MTVLQFRRVMAPPLGLAENGAGRLLFGDSGRPVSNSAPSDTEHAGSFHASHGFGESFVSDAHRYRDEDDWGVDGALGVVVWLAAAILLGAGGIGWWLA